MELQIQSEKGNFLHAQQQELLQALNPALLDRRSRNHLKASALSSLSHNRR